MSIVSHIIDITKFKNTKSRANADSLFRLPLSFQILTDPDLTSSTAVQFKIHQLVALHVTSKQIAEATRKDPLFHPTGLAGLHRTVIAIILLS